MIRRSGDRARRPIGLTLLIGLWAAYAILPLLSLAGVPGFEAIAAVRLLDRGEWEGIGSAAASVIAVSTGIGLLLERPWGWLLAMLTVGLGLAADIAAYVRGDPGYAYLALGVVIVFYLNQEAVRQRFLNVATRS